MLTSKLPDVFVNAEGPLSAPRHAVLLESPGPVSPGTGVTVAEQALMPTQAGQGERRCTYTELTDIWILQVYSPGARPCP
uniref:Uncharacterized protein n=1 Tax=Chinchilla lanigera TaxID=34839 RepID=A0A8C2YML4_CHILA